MITKAQHEANHYFAAIDLETFIDSEIKRQSASEKVYVDFPPRVDWKILNSLREKYENAGWTIRASKWRATWRMS